jgi:hypothetical protein
MRRTIVLLVLAMVVSACGSDEPGTQQPPSTTTTQAQAATTTTPPAPTTTEPHPGALECEIKGYPCSYADVPDEILERGNEMAVEVLAMFSDGSSPEEVEAWLNDQPDVVEVQVEDPALRFRLEGGRGTWVWRAGVFGTAERHSIGAGDAGHQPALPAYRHIVGEEAKEKQAVVLSPFLWDFGATDDGPGVASILEGTRGYEGGVRFAANESIDATNVTIDSFRAWDGYDVVHVATHGAVLCKPLPWCRTGIAASVLHGALPKEEGVTEARVLVPAIKAIPHRGWELAVAVHPLAKVYVPIVILTADFFRDQYPGGLDNAIIFFNACDSLGAGGTDLADAVSGSKSIYLGWDRSVDTTAAGVAGIALYEEMSETGHTLGESFEILGALRTDAKTGARLDHTPRKAGGDLRIRDIVYLRHPDSGEILDTSAPVSIEGVPGDGENDSVPWVVEVEGITAEEASGATLHVAIDGVEAEPEDLSAWAADIDDMRRVTGLLDLGYDVEGDITVDARAWVELPSGGISEHETDTSLSTGPCVAGTWTIRNGDVQRILASSLGDVAVEVFADGTVTATFDPDGTVVYQFGGWSIGNTVFTESPIPGVIVEQHGRVSTDSNGTAEGTWSIEGENLVLFVAQFDTTVVQRIVTPEIGLDVSTPAPPELARVYVIPNGATGFTCSGDRLSVDWTSGSSVTWTRSTG